ncbi:MAG: 50S ribosomal protein L9 [Termitinemataceae bacterium]|nr:MAG: 50S ribosomal protein L9 [Termitinemataceae bacterium]
MKVILNKDLSTLGEEGDVKDVAKGYARNFLFPRGIALPYTQRTISIFEARKDEIEARKEQKRKDAAGLQERLEGTEISIAMPSGENGKLYGAVTSHTIADELLKQGFQIERKRIEIPGNSIKSVGKYKITIKLYGNSQAEVPLSVTAQVEKTEEKAAPAKKRRSHSNAGDEESTTEATEAPSTEAPSTEAQAETSAPTESSASTEASESAE